MADVHELLDTWIANVKDEELLAELNTMKEQGDEDAITDAFFQDLAFGTAGLRGTIGAGTNRMNIYTVGRATQGFADYLNATFEHPTVAIARDSRNKGELFVKTTAAILAANGVTALVYPKISPVPTLSWAVRDLKCSGGICMTASHNPAPYNGYKAYGPDGCQITSEAADAISKAIAETDTFTGVKSMDFDEALEQGLVKWIDDSCLERYYDAVLARGVTNLSAEEIAGAPLKLVYTPLNGTGLIPVTTVLERAGITDVTVVPEQKEPNGDFPTCPYPNPEIRQAMQKGIDLCEQVHPDLLLATDPDADRVGVAVKNGDDYLLLTGNEMGVLLLDYICKTRAARGEDLTKKVAVTTIVSSAMVDALADEYGFELRRCLTGFKYIGDIITSLSDAGEVDRFIFGFEESYGCLIGTHARDKDAIVATMALCEAAAYYKTQGKTLWDAMIDMYEKYGYYKDDIQSITLKGIEGLEKIQSILETLRKNPPKEIGSYQVTSARDYKLDTIKDMKTGEVKPTGLPASNVLYYDLNDGAWLCVRPSGTEPKVKFYYGVKGTSLEDADKKSAAMGEEVLAMIQKML